MIHGRSQTCHWSMKELIGVAKLSVQNTQSLVSVNLTYSLWGGFSNSKCCWYVTKELYCMQMWMLYACDAGQSNLQESPLQRDSAAQCSHKAHV